jgi:hypothetical protein
MAPTAFIELGLACDLFEKGATYSRRVRSGSVGVLRAFFTSQAVNMMP